MYKNDIKKAVDAASGLGSFANWAKAAGSVVKLAELTKLIKLSKAGNIFVFSAKLLGAALSFVQRQQEKWWNSALIAILEGKIRAVRYTIIEQPTEYPKIWRVFERI